MCEGVEAHKIDEGYFGDVRLDGLIYGARYRWPGPVHEGGGVAQGVGQILMEQVAYERDSGQLLSGSFMDYAMPRADNFGPMEIASNDVPTKRNPLGVKGAGEAGTVGAMPALMNAIMNALAEVGVEHLDMPATPERVWRAIAEARS